MGSALSSMAVLLFAAAGVLSVPLTTTADIVADGQIREPEWANARRIAMAEGVSVLVKADAQTVAIAVRNAPRGAPQYTDLFIVAEDGQVWNLHASMQLGERKLPGRAWTDDAPAFAWGNNVDWRANEVAVKPGADADAPFAAQVQPCDGQEFLIARRKLPGKRWGVRIEVRDFMNERPDLAHPEGSDRHDSGGWAAIALP